MSKQWKPATTRVRCLANWKFRNKIVSTVRLIVALSDPEPSHLVLQGRTLETQAFGRSAVTRYLPARRFQSVTDDLPLGFTEGRGRDRNIVRMRDLKLSDWYF
jgi:hypothetical protein